MSAEDGLNIEKYVHSGSIDERADSYPGHEVLSPTAVELEAKAEKAKAWLRDAREVYRATKSELALNIMGAYAEVAWSGIVLSARHDTPSLIVVGLATGMRVGGYLHDGIDIVRSEIRDPFKRYQMEKRRILNEYPDNDLQSIEKRHQMLQQARDEYETARQKYLDPSDFNADKIVLPNLVDVDDEEES